MCRFGVNTEIENKTKIERLNIFGVAQARRRSLNSIESVDKFPSIPIYFSNYSIALATNVLYLYNGKY